MINNKLFGEYFKRLRLSRSLTYEHALVGIGLPIEELWISRLKEAEESGVMKNRFFKRIKTFYGVTDEILSSINMAANEQRLRNTDYGRIISFMKQIFDNRDLILATPKYSNIQVEGASLQSPYMGGGQLSLGVLLKIWSNKELVCKCDRCGGNVYLFGGIWAFTSMKHWGHCVECKRYSCYCVGQPQFKRNYSSAWSVSASHRREESTTVKSMLRDILKGDEHYEDLVAEYHLAENDDKPEKTEFDPGSLYYKGRELTL